MSAGAARRAPSGAASQERLRRASSLLFAALVLATFGAFFLAQHLKHIPTAVQDLRYDPSFYPEGGGVPRSEPISFQIERADRVTVRILDAKGKAVATIASGLRLSAYTELKLQWYGGVGVQRLPHAAARSAREGSRVRPAAYSLAPAGEYHVQVLLAQRHVEVRSPSAVRLVREHAS